MEVTLLGTGDTTGTPTPNCGCETCESARERGVERTRFSVHVHNERTGQSLLVDASPDFRQQFLTHDVDLPDAIVVTHIHFDHLDGLGNAYRLLEGVEVFAADEIDPLTGESVSGTIDRKYDYLDTITVEKQSPYDPFLASGFEVTLVRVEHPPLICYGLLVEDPETGGTLAMTGDSNFDLPDRSREVLTGSDLLLVDGIVPARHADFHPAGGDHHDEDGVARTFGRKHMTIEGARSMATKLEAEDYRIVHLSHYIPADEAFDDDMAVDGQRFEL